jgi:tetratricopeptide (TPR) repeat protein
VFAIVLGLALAGLGASGAQNQTPLFEGLGNYTREVTTKSPEAQKYFNQGLALVHGFNHGAAIRSFQEAARIDPTCAMAHWGIALASGPHINFPFVPPPAAELAWKELTLAQENAAANASPVEKALIGALAKRYANPQPEDRAPLDLAYANAMREVWKAYPKDPDVGAFFAEAMMDLRPWDQWAPDGVAQPGTEEIVATLEAVLKLEPDHPFANHLTIHALEASRHPERAVAAADRLLHLQPGLAHNVHMPSHIYIRVGQWQKAVETNALAVEADRRFRAAAGPPKGFLPVYIAHNEHMLAYAAMMVGQREVAMQHIRALVAGLPKEFLDEFGIVAGAWTAMPAEVLVRFGRWDEVLAEPLAPETFPFSHAFGFAARGIAHAAKGDIARAREQQQAYLAAAAKVKPEEMAAGNNPCLNVLAIVTPMLEGEILIREGKLDEGFAALREAVKAEDALKYDEPPAWLIPVRHSLGASLMKAGRFAEAEQVYRDDLARLPDNGWSLYGLSEALKRQNKTDDATPILTRFKTVWSNADTPITSSCLCQPGET